ncbi:hypothetical protein MRX96_046392 [Rhipicephalus microplus]
MFVYAEYEHFFDTAVVEHRRVLNSEWKRFEPKHANDFDRTRTYYVRSCRRESSKCAYEGAKIIHMTGTLEKIATFRAKRPRRTAVGRVDIDEGVCDARPPLCKDRDHIREEERQQQIDDALNDYKLERATISAVTDLQQRLLAAEKELERLREEGRIERPSVAVSTSDFVPKNVYDDLAEQYKKIQIDFRILKSNHEQLIKRFEDINRVEAHSVEPDNDEEMNSGSDSEESTRNDSNLPRIGSVGENGKDRSVTGTPYIRYASSGKCNVRLPMTPEKLNTLKDLFRLYVGKDPLAQQRLKAVRNHLAVGLYDIRLPELESSAAFSLACDDESIDDQDLGSSPGELGSGQSKLDGSQHDLGQQTIIGSSRDNGKVYAGCGRWVDRECWDFLMRSSSNSTFCRSACSIY